MQLGCLLNIWEMNDEPDRCSVMMRIFVAGKYDFETDFVVSAGEASVVNFWLKSAFLKS